MTVVYTNSFKFRVADATRDVGVQYTAGKSNIHTKNILYGRFSNTTRRNKKVIQLSKICKYSRKLFSGSTYSAGLWGHQTILLPESKVIQIEKRGAQSTGINVSGRCRFFACIVAYGDRGHPVARLIKDIFTSWFQVLEDFCTDRNMQDVKQAWNITRSKVYITKSYKSINNRHGLMHNVISWLFRLGWNPYAVDLWLDSVGQAYEPANADTPVHLILHELVDAYNRTRLRELGHIRNSKGIEDGVEFKATLVNLRNNKLKKNYPLMSALEVAMCGGMWPNERVNQCYPEVSPLCSRCGTELDTDLHCLYTCKHNELIGDEFVANTQELIAKAIEESHQFPCLWFRGILPYSKNTNRTTRQTYSIY